MYKVLSLQSQIEMLSKDQVKSDERNNRQRDENCQLQERLLELTSTIFSTFKIINQY